MYFEQEYPLLASTDPQSCIAGKIMRSNRIITGIFRKHISKHDVTPPQLSLMLVVAKQGQVGQTELGEMLAMERSTVSRDLNRLLISGFISKSGGRRATIEITPRGARFVELILPDWRAAMDEIEEILGSDGLEGLNTMHDHLMDQ